MMIFSAVTEITVKLCCDVLISITTTKNQVDKSQQNFDKFKDFCGTLGMPHYANNDDVDDVIMYTEIKIIARYF